MELLIFIFLLIPGICLGYIIYFLLIRYRLSKFLKRIAGKYKLTYSEGLLFSFPHVSGRTDNFPILIERYTVQRDLRVQIIKFEVDISHRNLQPFSISSEGFISYIKKVFGIEDILIGDESFDRKMLVKGYDIPQLHILLNQKARFLISGLINSAYRTHFRINEKKISCLIPFYKIKNLIDMETRINNILSLANIVCRKGRTAELLKENYLTETETKVKRKLLDTLYYLKESLSSDDPIIKSAFFEQDFEIQFLAAKLLQKNKYERIRMLYEMDDEHIQKRIIEYLKNKAETTFLGYFLKKAVKETSIRVKQALVDYFRVIGDVKAEPFLRKELSGIQGDETGSDYTAYRLTIIRALKYCGTYESIESLSRIKQISLKREADEAIAMIQYRIGPGGRGWLSICTENDENGKLSLTDE